MEEGWWADGKDCGCGILGWGLLVGFSSGQDWDMRMMEMETIEQFGSGCGPEG